MTTRTAVTTAVLLLALTSACGGDDGGDDGGDQPGAAPSSAVTSGAGEEPDFVSGDNAPDPCSLLTTAEVSAAVGAAVGEGERTVDDGPLGGESCLWSTSSVPVRTFQIALKDGGDVSVPGLTPEGLFDQSLSTLPGLTAASGVGDKAAFGAATGLVYADGVYVLTSVGLGSSSTATTALRTLTEKAVAGL